MENENAFRKDLLRFAEEYHWEPRITTKLLNLRYGTAFSAEEVKAIYSDCRNQSINPVESILNKENRHSPALNYSDPWD